MDGRVKTVLIMVLLAAVLATMLALAQGHSLWDIAKFPVFFEVGNSLGWNWVSVTCMAAMLWVGFSKSAKIMAPLSSKNAALVVCMAVFPLLFYYTFLDMFPRMLSAAVVYSVRGIDPIPFISNYLIWVTLVNVLPTNLIGFFMYAGFTYAFAWKRLDFKYFAVASLVSFAANTSVLGLFGELNIRLLSESNRLIAYYAISMPGWLLFTFCYAKMWKKNKIPTEEEKICMGD